MWYLKYYFWQTFICCMLSINLIGSTPLDVSLRDEDTNKNGSPVQNPSKDLISSPSRKQYNNDATNLKDNDVGYIKKSNEMGKDGYKRFETFHNSDGDSFGYEKHESFGKSNDDDYSGDDYNDSGESGEGEHFDDGSDKKAENYILDGITAANTYEVVEPIHEDIGHKNGKGTDKNNYDYKAVFSESTGDGYEEYDDDDNDNEEDDERGGKHPPNKVNKSYRNDNSIEQDKNKYKKSDEDIYDEYEEDSLEYNNKAVPLTNKVNVHGKHKNVQSVGVKRNDGPGFSLRVTHGDYHNGAGNDNVEHDDDDDTDNGAHDAGKEADVNIQVKHDAGHGAGGGGNNAGHGGGNDNDGGGNGGGHDGGAGGGGGHVNNIGRNEYETHVVHFPVENKSPKLSSHVIERYSIQDSTSVKTSSHKIIPFKSVKLSKKKNYIENDNKEKIKSKSLKPKTNPDYYGNYEDINDYSEEQTASPKLKSSSGDSSAHYRKDNDDYNYGTHFIYASDADTDAYY